jgi:prophage antirepressor-like protein
MVQVFDNEMFGALRVVVTDDQKTLFNLADVCRALEINNPRQVKARLEQRGVIIADTPTENQHGAVVMQPMTYIDEPNLYRCIFQSRKAEAGKQKDSTYLVWTPKGAEMIYKMIKAKLE